jgi:hypothetical protein
VLTRAPLWNGNRERPLSLLRWDPKHSIIRWAWTQHGSYVARYSSLMVAPAYAGLPFLRLRSHEDSEHLLRSLEASLPHPAGSTWTSRLSTGPTAKGTTRR